MATTGAQGTFRGHLIPEDHLKSKLGDTDRAWVLVEAQDINASGTVDVGGNLAVAGAVAITGGVSFGTTLGTPGTGVVQSDGPMAVRQTILTLTNVVVEVVSVTSGNGVGGTSIYSFPDGQVRFLGASAALTISVATAKQADFEATPAGDIGIGTVVPANADAFGTDATDDDIATGVAFNMEAGFTDDVTLTSEGVQLLPTAEEIFVNVLVDAADIDDDTTSEVLVNGTVVLTWAALAAV